MIANTILVPTDFSADSDKAIETAVSLAKSFEAKVVLLHSYHAEIPMVSTIEGPYVLPAGFYQELAIASREKLEGMAKALREKEGIEVEGLAISEPAVYAILGQAEEKSADLIVMGTRGLTGLKHAILGSVTERVLRTAPCPVLSVHADG